MIIPFACIAYNNSCNIEFNIYVIKKDCVIRDIAVNKICQIDDWYVTSNCFAAGNSKLRISYFATR